MFDMIFLFIFLIVLVIVVMRMTDKMYWEKQDHFDLVYPYGAVTLRISRI